MINSRHFIGIFLLLMLLACNYGQNPSKENDNAFSYVQEGETFTFPDESPRYMIRYNASADKEIPLSDTGFIRSYSATDSNPAVGHPVSGSRIARTVSAEASPSAERKGVNVILTDPDYRIGEKKDFYICDYDDESNAYYRTASMTLRAIGEHCLVWLEDGLDTELSDDFFQTLKEKFDSIYTLETELFGSCTDYTVNDTEQFPTEVNGKIYINIVSQNSSTIAGFFNPADMYRASFIEKINQEYEVNYKTNEARSFYLNADTLSVDNCSVKNIEECVSSLTHEFQHMLRFICDDIVKGVETPRWYNEMMSLLAEDIFCGYLNLGVGSSAIARLQYFKLFTNWGVTCWDDTDFFYFEASYSVNYAFGAYLLRNYGGADLIAALTDFDTAGTGKDAIEHAFRKLGLKNKEGAPLTFEDVVADFHQICIYTTKDDADKGHLSLNREVNIRIGDVMITAPAINLLNICDVQGENSDTSVIYYPYSEIITDDMYAAKRLYPYGFILSDLTQDEEGSGEEPINDAKTIVMDLPADPDVSIYFY